MDDMLTEAARSARAVYRYFGAVMALSAPFWLLEAVFGWELLPGLPASAMMAVVPGSVAFAFVARADGRHRALRWVARSSRLPPPALAHWLVVAVLLPPAILAAAYAGMLFAGHRFPESEPDVVGAATLLVIFFVPAVLEELGWSSFALVALQRHRSALGASLLLGSVWAAWHVVPLLQAQRSSGWIAWWALGTLGLRVLITWIFNHGSGSAIVAALFHASVNASWQSFPIRGSHFDPAFHSLCVWGACSVILVGFRREMLAKPAPARQTAKLDAAMDGTERRD